VSRTKNIDSPIYSIRPFINGTFSNYGLFVIFLTIRYHIPDLVARGIEKRVMKKLAKNDGYFFILGI